MTSAQGATSFYTECGKEYTLTASLKDYDPSSVTLAKAKGGKTQTEILLNPIEVIITETHVVLNDIYFEFDKSHITEQGAKELDKLVKVMNDHPNMVIFVKSHTDTKGSDKYNQRLSEQRAQSTVQYVISKGIKQERITGKGFGESEPKVDCKDNCTEEEDAQNRRSEFVIVKK
jgi:outer membrane protein OmpA-like peptidoglycan-associated protein